MNLGRKQLVLIYILIIPILLAAVPAFGQRATFGIDVGQTSDRFGALPRNSALVGDIEGEVVVLERASKQGDPNIVAGGEIRLPADTSAHANEFAGFAGADFHLGDRFILGIHVQARKIYQPTSFTDGQFFTRYKMLFLEIPVVAEYRFGALKRGFVQVQGSWEFSPRFGDPKTGTPVYPHPTFDHGYFVRGSAGYTFGRWYAKATYESRFLKFQQDLGNPNNLNNWRTDRATGGVGFSF